MEWLAGQPGVVGYRVKNETLWDIAKAFHTTEDEITDTNALKSPILQPGQKLVIVKQME
jgi:LysM repeat protein